MWRFLVSWNVNLSNILRLTRDAVLIFAITGYYMGWLYLKGFLDNVGIPFSVIEIPFYDYFVYSTTPIISGISNYWYVLALYVLISWVILSFARNLRFIFVVSAISLGFFAMYSMSIFSQRVGENNARVFISVAKTQSPIILYFTKAFIDENKVTLTELIDANDKEKLRLIWSRKGAIYVLNVDNKRVFEISNKYYVAAAKTIN